MPGEDSERWATSAPHVFFGFFWLFFLPPDYCRGSIFTLVSHSVFSHCVLSDVLTVETLYVFPLLPLIVPALDIHQPGKQMKRDDRFE